MRHLWYIILYYYLYYFSGERAAPQLQPPVLPLPRWSPAPRPVGGGIQSQAKKLFLHFLFSFSFKRVWVSRQEGQGGAKTQIPQFSHIQCVVQAIVEAAQAGLDFHRNLFQRPWRRLQVSSSISDRDDHRAFPFQGKGSENFQRSSVEWLLPSSGERQKDARKSQGGGKSKKAVGEGE